MAGIHAIQKGERIVQLIVEGKVYDVGMTNEQYNLLLEVLASEAQRKIDEGIRQDNELQRQKNEYGPNLDGNGGRVGQEKNRVTQENARQEKINNFIDAAKKIGITANVSDAGLFSTTYTTLKYDANTGKFSADGPHSSSYDIAAAIANAIKNSANQIYNDVVKPEVIEWKGDTTPPKGILAIDYFTGQNGNGKTKMFKPIIVKDTYGTDDGHVLMRRFCNQVTIQCIGSNASGKAWDTSSANNNAILAGEALIFKIEEEKFRPKLDVQTMASIGGSGHYSYVRIYANTGNVKIMHPVQFDKEKGTIKREALGENALICFNISYEAKTP